MSKTGFLVGKWKVIQTVSARIKKKIVVGTEQHAVLIQGKRETSSQ
jgi:hypothetical protein